MASFIRCPSCGTVLDTFSDFVKTAKSAIQINAINEKKLPNVDPHYANLAVNNEISLFKLF